jgi:hypothetical protein
MTCAPEEVSATFNKKNGNWYDDDFINYSGGNKQNGNNADQVDGDDANTDDLYDDQYLAANDDVSQDDGNNGRRLAESTWAAGLEVRVLCD